MAVSFFADRHNLWYLFRKLDPYPDPRILFISADRFTLCSTFIQGHVLTATFCNSDVCNRENAVDGKSRNCGASSRFRLTSAEFSRPRIIECARYGEVLGPSMNEYVVEE